MRPHQGGRYWNPGGLGPPVVAEADRNRRALIAWNGEEEILILSTDLRASRATKVLEVMPFPAEPRVTKGDVAVFRRAVWLINSKIRLPEPQATGRGRLDRATAFAPPAGELTFHERIGAHDVAGCSLSPGLHGSGRSPPVVECIDFGEDKGTGAARHPLNWQTIPFGPPHCSAP